ncbi:hypothetical protein SEPCBS57363_002190 [Sporothrix epigloea]|uniref:Uncharacterized protein n=1 Tax=Sporothrix epigloea TaxID=1892477 RepID=A0ABP0DG62_9PEZI
MDRARGGGRSRASGATNSGINITAAADPSSVTSFAWPQSHSSRAQNGHTFSPSHTHISSRRSQSSASPAKIVNGLSSSQASSDTAAVISFQSPSPSHTQSRPQSHANSHSHSQYQSSSSHAPSHLSYPAPPPPLARDRSRTSLRHTSPERASVSHSSSSQISAASRSRPRISNQSPPLTSVYTSQALTASPPASPSIVKRVAPPATVPPSAALTRRRSSRAHDAEPLTVGQAYAAAYAAATAAELEMSKGGHSLRKRTRVDYQHMDNGDPTPSSSGEQTGEETNGDDTEAAPTPTPAPAPAPLTVATPALATPAKRGRKRKAVHNAGQGAGSGVAGDDEVSSPPSPALASKKIRLVHNGAATTSNTTQSSPTNGRTANDTLAAPAPRGRGRPPNKKPTVTVKHTSASSPTGAAQTKQAATAGTLPTSAAVQSYNTIKVGDSPLNNGSYELESPDNVTPGQRLASSRSSAPSHKAALTMAPTVAASTASVPAAKSMKLTGPVSALKNASAPLANGHTPGKVGRPRRQSKVVTPSKKVSEDVAKDSLPLLTSDHGSASPETLDTTASSQESSPRRLRHRNHRLMLRIPRGRNRSPPSVYVLASSEDEERYAAFMEARAADAKAGSMVLPTFDAFDARKKISAVDSGERVEKSKTAKANLEEEAKVDTAKVANGYDADTDVFMEETHSHDRPISPVALRSMTRRTSTRIASATAQKEQPSIDSHEAFPKEEKDASVSAARPDKAKTKQANASSTTRASDTANSSATPTATLFATANGHGRTTTTTRRASTSHRMWKTLTPFEDETVFLPEQFYDNITMATAVVSSEPTTQSVDTVGRSGRTETAEQPTPLALGSETPALVDLEAVLQEKIAADTRLEEAAAAAADAAVTPDVVVDSGATTPVSTTPTDLPAAITLRDKATPSVGREPVWKKQFRFQKIRDPKEFVDALQNHKDMSTEELFACLAHINDSLRAWQDEYRLLRGITDDEENAVRRRQQDATFINRTLMAQKRGNVDTEITERDFVVKGIRAPESLTDPIKRYTRQQDKLQSNVYLFEYDPRDSMIGRQDPLAQRQGLQNTRLRNRPKQTLKAAEAEAADESNGLGAGRRTRRGRKAVNAVDDESGEDSRAGTPVPFAPAPIAPISTVAATTPAVPPTRGRRGRPPGPAAIAAAAAAAAAAAVAAENKTDDEDLQTDAAPIITAAQTPTKRGRRGRVPRSMLSESVVADGPAEDDKETKEATSALRESPATPEKKAATAAAAANVSPLAPGGPGKRRRGRKPNSLLRQEALEAEAAAAAAATAAEANEEDGDGNETATETTPQGSVTGRSNNKRARTSMSNSKRDGGGLRAIGPGTFYKGGAASRRSSASSNETTEATPPTSSTKAVDSSYGLRPKRRRKFRAVHNGLDDDSENEEQEQHTSNGNGDAINGVDASTSGPPAKKQRLRQRTAGAVAPTTKESVATAPAEAASESMTAADHSDMHFSTAPMRASPTPTPTPTPGSNNNSNSAAYPPPLGGYDAGMPAYDAYPPLFREHVHHGGPAPPPQQYQQHSQQQPPLPPHAAYYGRSMDPYYGHQQQQQQGPPPPPHQHMYGNPYASHQQQQQQRSPPPQHQVHQPPSSSYFGQSQPYHSHQQPPPHREQQQQHHNSMAISTNTSALPPHPQAQPPTSGRQRTIFKIKNYTPAPVTPSAGVHAFTQMIHNKSGGAGSGGSNRRESFNSTSHRQSLSNNGAPHGMPSLAQFLPQTPGDPNGLGQINSSGMVSIGSPSSGGGAPGTPSDSSMAGNDKDYRQMTKSEKMSHSMKTRWANGSMQAAVAKRKATLAAKKVAAQQAQHQITTVNLNTGPLPNTMGTSSLSPIGRHTHPHLSALGDPSHIGHGSVGMSLSDGHGGPGPAHHMPEYGYHRPYMAGVSAYDTHPHHYGGASPGSPPHSNGMLYAANNRQDA